MKKKTSEKANPDGFSKLKMNELANLNCKFIRESFFLFSKKKSFFGLHKEKWGQLFMPNYKPR